MIMPELRGEKISDRKACMASRYNYSKALRTIGQELEKRGIDMFELRCHRADYTVLCGDPEPPHTGLLEIGFSGAEIRSLDLLAARQRSDSFKPAIFDQLPEVLRALGRYVENKEGEILRISTATSTSALDAFRVEYESRDGHINAEELTPLAVADMAMRMYRIRLSGQTQRNWRN
jgi:hypothetical protein